MSYGSGTAAGPGAIVKASQQLELYDDELECEPYRAWGVATVREPTIARPIEAALDQLAGLVEGVLAEGKFPFVLGGEHSLTLGAIRPVAARNPGLVGAAARRPRRPARRLSGRALLACRRHAPGAGPGGRLPRLGRHPRGVDGGGGVLRGQPRPHHHPLGQGPGTLGHRADRRPAPRPPGLRHLRYRRAGFLGDAGDRHANSRRAVLWPDARAAAARVRGGRDGWSGRPRRVRAPLPACTRTTTRPRALAYKMRPAT